MKKYSFKKLVSGCIKEISLNNLIEMKNEHSKSKNIWPSNEMKAYLTTNELSTAEKQFLFSMRCRMNETKNNFKTKYKNKINCSLCSGNYEETEIHLLQCEGITFEQELKTKVLNMKYSYIFASLEKQIKAIKLWTKIYKIREWKLEARKLSPVDTRSTSLSASPAYDTPLDLDVDLSLLFGDSYMPHQNLSVYVCDFGY